MGLDQYATAQKAEERIEIMYWRKHANLQGWMENLYISRGGTEQFNCVDLKLSPEDIDRLEEEHATLETVTGFFFGSTTEAKIQATQEFISMARSYMNDGYEIIYSSWW